MNNRNPTKAPPPLVIVLLAAVVLIGGRALEHWAVTGTWTVTRHNGMPGIYQHVWMARHNSAPLERLWARTGLPCPIHFINTQMPQPPNNPRPFGVAQAFSGGTLTLFWNDPPPQPRPRDFYDVRTKTYHEKP